MGEKLEAQDHVVGVSEVVVEMDTDEESLYKQRECRLLPQELQLLQPQL
jgi:hypothetical protein